MRLIVGISLLSPLDASAPRQRTRQVAALCGFGTRERTRLSTTVSELVRGAVDNAHPGKLTLSLDGEGAARTLVICLDAPPRANAGAGRLLPVDEYAPLPSDAVLAASRAFMDRIEVDPDGARMTLYKACPASDSSTGMGTIDLTVDDLAALTGAAGLSEAHRRNRDLESQADSLLSADRRKDEFLAILAHELRGPLSALAMAGELLQRSPPDPERIAGMGQMITRQTAHMSRLVEDLLDVSRIVRNEVVIDRLPVDLVDVLGAAVEQLGPSAQRRQLRLATSVPAGPAMVSGDRTRLTQVVANLIGNAIRYTPEQGAIDVVLEVDSAAVRLSVTDTGIGIAPELQPQLFDLFVQAHRSTASRESGLGLGLALVKALMEAHGGTVAVRSDGLGHGSHFEINLPRAA